MVPRHHHCSRFCHRLVRARPKRHAGYAVGGHAPVPVTPHSLIATAVTERHQEGKIGTSRAEKFAVTLRM
ncbi:MAG: hypothetical protein IPG54_01620 [Sphingomonadales bacterium]|jgi:hypothetical protein|nr:hypothetical protein [Sphingomonadales bacterium]MCP5384195.1 hypothetical protein [Altererythrobacter sp.]MCP5392921.1 hypothetical protein [Sphingomonadaceae bacterium]MBK9003599.1 hypothetical protein [Sphingomonadales bacterium]MBK9268725.1 hypothetical protein [Sphingomonadales bacterium]